MSQPVEKKSLAEKAYTVLRERIAVGEMPPGQAFTEKEVSEMIGLGATPVREALARLRHDGLIAIIPRKGYRVRTISLQDVEHFFDAWYILAPAIIELGLPLVSESQAALLRQTRSRANRLAASSKANDQREYWKLGMEIFQILAEATRNEHIITMLTRIYYHALRISAVFYPWEHREMRESFSDYLAAPKQSDPKEAAEFVREAIRSTRTTVLANIAQHPLSISPGADWGGSAVRQARRPAASGPKRPGPSRPRTAAAK